MSAYTPACVRGLPGLGLGFEGVYVATRACAALSYRGGVSVSVRVCVSVCVSVWAPGRTWAWGAPRSNHRRTLPAPPQPLRPRGVCPCPCPCPCPPTHPPPLARRQHTSSTGQLRRTLQGHSRTVWAVAIAPNGDYIVSASDDQTVRIWDSASGMSAYTPACVRGLPGLGLGFEGVYVATRACAALSYRGGVSVSVRVCVSVCVSVWAPGRTWAWGAPRSNHRRTLPAPPQPLRPRGVCPCPCPCPCPPTHPPPLARRQHTSSTGQLRRTLQGHSRTVWAVAIAPNGDYIVSGSDDETVRIWDSASGMSAHTPARVRGLPGLGLGFEGVYVATRACAALSYRGGVSGGVRVCVSVCVSVWAPGRTWAWGAPRSNHRRTLPAPPQPLRPRGVCPCPCPCPWPPTHPPPLAR